MPLEANLFYGGTTSPSSTRGVKPKRLVADLTASRSAMASHAGSSLASTSRSVHTPSPNRTSRIPPPPSSPSPSTRTTTSSRRRPASTAKVSPSSFKVHFQGRVYRPFAATSPTGARKLYSPSRGLLGRPDELVEHADAIIDCTCQRNEDDSTLMIQCESCDVWLHARCVGYEYEEQCPDQYYCKKCAPFCSSNSGGDTTARPHTPCRTTPEIQELRTAENGQLPSPASTAVPLSDSEEDGGLEVEIPALLDASPLNRTPTRTPTKRTANSPSQYTVSRNLLSELANASPIIKAGPSHPLLTPSKRPKAESSVADTSVEQDSIVTPQNRSMSSQQSHSPLNSSTVPLPDHYTALLNLHVAVERALLLHLATDGARACSAPIVSCDTSPASPNGSEKLFVDLPNLATFTSIRSVVERGSGRRFGPVELAQLAWLWGGGLSGPQVTEHNLASSESTSSPQLERKDRGRGGLSMSVSAAREIDRNNGKRVYTWGIGIHLELKQNAQLPALELVGSTTPSRSSQTTESSPALNIKRIGLSVLPLWSSKAEYRREELRRRLGECVLKAHDDFTCGRPTGDLQTAHKKQRFSDPFAREPHLPPTPPPSNTKKYDDAATRVFAKGFILDALPPIPAASLPPLGPSSLPSLSHTSATRGNGTANADTAEIAQAEKAAMLPSTRDTIAGAKSSMEERISTLLDGNVKRLPKAPAEERAMSLLDRIKAKEAAQQAEKEAQATHSSSTSLSLSKTASRTTHRSAALASLEAASARAKKKASQRAA